MSVTDAENGNAESEYSGIDVRAACFENAGGATGDDNATTLLQFGCGRVAGLNIGINTKFADTPSD